MADGEIGMFLCQRWGGRFHRPGMAPVDVRFSDGAVLPGGTEDKHLQYRGDGVPDFLGGWGTGRRSLHPEDNARWEEF